VICQALDRSHGSTATSFAAAVTYVYTCSGVRVAVNYSQREFDQFRSIKQERCPTTLPVSTEFVNSATSSTSSRWGGRSVGVQRSLRQSTQLFHWTQSGVVAPSRKVFVASFTMRFAHCRRLHAAWVGRPKPVRQGGGPGSLAHRPSSAFDTFAASTRCSEKLSPLKRSKSNDDLTNQLHTDTCLLQRLLNTQKIHSQISAISYDVWSTLVCMHVNVNLFGWILNMLINCKKSFCLRVGQRCDAVCANVVTIMVNRFHG